jgi:hypothetical protein
LKVCVFHKLCSNDLQLAKAPEAVIRNHNHLKPLDIDFKSGMAAERQQRICLTGAATCLLYRHTDTKQSNFTLVLSLKMEVHQKDHFCW